ncbi:PepSY domain-containing protein [Paenibacillus sp. UMB4589-SE434]|uniref:PepSY domain-containing protein n=1 Tax=Paenibacillus sp. UMB4589-SE434 TaxID=3046314 RepID=UPI00254C1DB9|nr:PepSY domain-containing protein [Paenibacillus sp. UMB4589-SE434]MDK8180911.1 PepSY domain-containing protein [Paenibacillus sp. UMB4589-SE434]
MNKRTKIVAGLLGGIMLIAGISMGTAHIAQAGYSSSTGSKLAGQVKDSNPAALLEMNEAKQIALATVKEGIIEEIELHKQGGRYYYEVEFSNRADNADELYIDALTGKATWEKKSIKNQIKHESKHEQVSMQDTKHTQGITTQNNQPAKTKQTISKEQAVKIALQQVSGSLIEIERDTDDGVSVYEVELRSVDGRYVQLDIAAADGRILQIEWDDKD